jgi:hypothetical protein
LGRERVAGCTDADTHAGPGFVLDAYPGADADANPGSGADTHSGADARTDADARSGTDADACSGADTNAYSGADAVRSNLGQLRHASARPLDGRGEFPPCQRGL